jgi:hypothetical protein
MFNSSQAARVTMINKAGQMVANRDTVDGAKWDKVVQTDPGFVNLGRVVWCETH